MRHRLLAVGYAAFALALAAFTGSALAGNGNGTTPPGQAKQDAAPAPAAQPAAPPAAQSAPAQKTTEQQAPSVCGSTTTVTKTEAKEEHGHAYGEDRRGEDKVKTKSKSVVVAGSCGQAAATVTPAAPCAPSTTTENV